MKPMFIILLIGFAALANPEKPYFPLAEGSTRQVLIMYEACMEKMDEQPAEKKATLEPTIFCDCLLDAMRLNLRSSGKFMPDDEKGIACRIVAENAKHHTK